MNTLEKTSPLAVRDDLRIELMRAFKTGPVVSVQKPDDNLLILGEMMGALARLITQPHPLQHRLLSIAAFAMQWGQFALGSRSVFFSDAHDEVLLERNRQRRLYRERKITFDCASPIVDNRRKYRVLLEEVGEVAEAVHQLEGKPDWKRSDHLATELIQVAAVAVAWLESLEVA